MVKVNQRSARSFLGSMPFREPALLVTVGTTGFSELIEAVYSKAFVERCAALGFRRVYVQYGNTPPSCDESVFDEYGVCSSWIEKLVD